MNVFQVILQALGIILLMGVLWGALWVGCYIYTWAVSMERRVRELGLICKALDNDQATSVHISNRVLWQLSEELRPKLDETESRVVHANARMDEVNIRIRSVNQDICDIKEKIMKSEACADNELREAKADLEEKFSRTIIEMDKRIREDLATYISIFQKNEKARKN